MRHKAEQEVCPGRYIQAPSGDRLVNKYTEGMVGFWDMSVFVNDNHILETDT